MSTYNNVPMTTCEGTHISKETIADHLVVMLELVDILYSSRMSIAVVVTIKLDFG